MNYLLVVCVICVAISLVCGQTETRGPKWGDVTGPYLFQERVVKGKIPLFTRSTSIKYPVVSCCCFLSWVQFLSPKKVAMDAGS